MAKTEAFSYVRVSGESQVGKDGPERQRRVIAAWAKRAKVSIVREFADLGVSGTTSWDARPAMLEMVSALVASGGKPPVVVVERPDRLARDLIAGELLLQKLNELGVRVIVAENGQALNSDDTPTGKLVRQILGAVSEFDRASIAIKLRATRTKKRLETGRCEGRKPYGHRDGEGEGLALIQSMAKEGATLQAIADKLNERGIPTRQGKPWLRGSVFSILKVAK
jgi:DNA invertase Pin-like site-specific DNA recombinase